METKVTTIDNAPTLEVDLSNPSPATVTQGFEAISVAVAKKDRRKGFGIDTYVCRACGERSDVAEGERKRCSWCKGTDLGQIDYMLSTDTDKVINRTLRYKCHTCGKLYDNPTDCCIAKYEVKNKLDYNKYYRGYMCLGCRKIYEEKVVCCAQSEMISGKYKPAPDSTRQLLGV